MNDNEHLFLYFDSQMISEKVAFPVCQLSGPGQQN